MAHWTGAAEGLGDSACCRPMVLGVGHKNAVLCACAAQAVLGLPCGTGIDCWSAGAMLAELALQRPLFPCHSPAQLLQQVGCRAAIPFRGS